MKLAAGLTALAAFAAFAAAPPPLASRPAETGCAWRLFSSPELGLEVPVQRCDFGFRVIDFGAGKTSLYQSMRDAGQKEDVYPVISMFEKKADETPDEAIRRVAFKKLTRYQRRHCSVTARHVPYLGLSKSAFTITPDEKYAAEVAEKAGTDVPPPPCGDLGESADSLTYFEFHAMENPRRFAFVSAGQDTPLFDESRLKFLP